MSGFIKEFKKYWLVWSALGFFVVLFGYLVISEFQSWFSLRQELTKREVEIQKIAERAEDITQEIENVSDPMYLEKKARLTLNLKGEGEDVFVVLGLNSISQEENFDEVYERSVETQNKLWLNIKSWWNYFFNNL